jgi:hypothetical protein
MPVAVMGGLALAAWGRARATKDVDLLVGCQPTQFPEIERIVQQKGFRLRFAGGPRKLGGMFVLQTDFHLKEAYLDIHVDFALADSEHTREALTRRIPLEIPGLPAGMFVLACEDLILYKLLAARIIDRADIQALLRANKARLDYAYLQLWAPRLGVHALLAELWSETFPGDAMPTGTPS